MADDMTVQVVHAWPGGTYFRELCLHEGATVAEALAACDLAQACPHLDVSMAPVGIFSRKVGRDHSLRDGDRVEIYRPLQMDPMQARRRRADRGG
ncbi:MULTISPECIES: RnfH family protein [Oleiagrimonas]|uniref:UPF0125 protein HF690_00570 n=1 Tax=Oleiagrimonas citrea TaxID=1665687 RepID=A0A846ZDR0_9GAMM|nr:MULTISPECIES: RnfH family protein [Oleiagrimonas]NKZ37444.1 RnfH family protein [Oleiagrimonas citrea]RAP57946.1 hypothetical protein BTJ49_08810 [Oleiagrimonas sp. MCCC 1A03011]